MQRNFHDIPDPDDDGSGTDFYNTIERLIQSFQALDNKDKTTTTESRSPYPQRKRLGNDLDYVDGSPDSNIIMLSSDEERQAVLNNHRLYHTRSLNRGVDPHSQRPRYPSGRGQNRIISAKTTIPPSPQLQPKQQQSGTFITIHDGDNGLYNPSPFTRGTGVRRTFSGVSRPYMNPTNGFEETYSDSYQYDSNSDFEDRNNGGSNRGVMLQSRGHSGSRPRNESQERKHGSRDRSSRSPQRQMSDNRDARRTQSLPRDNRHMSRSLDMDYEQDPFYYDPEVAKRHGNNPSVEYVAEAGINCLPSKKTYVINKHHQRLPVPEHQYCVQRHPENGKSYRLKKGVYYSDLDDSYNTEQSVFENSYDDSAYVSSDLSKEAPLLPSKLQNNVPPKPSHTENNNNYKKRISSLLLPTNKKKQLLLNDQHESKQRMLAMHNNYHSTDGLAHYVSNKDHGSILNLEKNKSKSIKSNSSSPPTSPNNIISDMGPEPRIRLTKEGYKFLELDVDVSGFRPEDIQIVTQGNLLQVIAKGTILKKGGGVDIDNGGGFQNDDDDDTRIYRELKRQFSLSETANAEYLHGVLTPSGVLQIRGPVGVASAGTNNNNRKLKRKKVKFHLDQ